MNIKVEETKKEDLDLQLGDIVEYKNFFFIAVKDVGATSPYLLKNLVNSGGMTGKHCSLQDLNKSVKKYLMNGEAKLYKASEYEIVIRKKGE